KIMGLGVYLVDHFRMPFWDWDTKGEFKKEDAYLISFDEEGNRKERPLAATDKKGPFGTEKDGPHTSEIFAESASKFIKKYKKKKPFMMYLAFHAPHDPRQAPEKFKKGYPEAEMSLPPSYAEQHPFDNGHMYLRDEALAPWPRTKGVAQKHLSDYYAAITHLDTQIGKVIQSLKKSGNYENTLIVFAGDSGLAVGNHGLMGKQNIYDEDGVHVPFILSGGVIQKKGTRIKKFTYIHDIFPTICELSGVAIPSSVKGKSLVPLLEGKTQSHRESTYHAYRQFQRAYREGDFKLIEYVRAKNYSKEKGEYYTGSRVTQLFNVKKDPWETQDLSFFPEYKNVVKEMQQAMKKRAVALGDKKENIEGEHYDFWDYY
ncbi:sulfatase-like hydrolase/transferase, partial [Aquimarina agarilytica]|uniref:sulfatase-like hydrolase/transferase n=1 Tax=Aquimarina agarilytica TaxID=1087449 RepID=UPI00028953F3